LESVIRKRKIESLKARLELSHNVCSSLAHELHDTTTECQRTAEQCFIKKGSKPPLCGVHSVHLTQERLRNEMIAFGYKAFTFLVCPVSGQVLNDEAASK
jgi:hypothetical protein